MSTKRIVVGAHYGLTDWLAQRITALVLIVYTIVLLGALLSVPELDYGTWSGLFASTGIKVMTLLALFALMWHAWIGVRNIFMDYIKPTGLRLFLQVAAIIVLAGYAWWAVIILWRV